MWCVLWRPSPFSLHSFLFPNNQPLPLLHPTALLCYCFFTILEATDPPSLAIPSAVQQVGVVSPLQSPTSRFSTAFPSQVCSCPLTTYHRPAYSCYPRPSFLAMTATFRVTTNLFPPSEDTRWWYLPLSSEQCCPTNTPAAATQFAAEEEVAGNLPRTSRR